VFKKENPSKEETNSSEEKMEINLNLKSAQVFLVEHLNRNESRCLAIEVKDTCFKMIQGPNNDMNIELKNFQIQKSDTLNLKEKYWKLIDYTYVLNPFEATISTPSQNKIKISMSQISTIISYHDLSFMIDFFQLMDPLLEAVQGKKIEELFSTRKIAITTKGFISTISRARKNGISCLKIQHRFN